MRPDRDKTREELLEEIAALRREKAAAEAEAARIQQTCTDFCMESLEKNTQGEGAATEALQIARVIIDNSPAILFRRLAGEDPRLVFVSANIRRFGYTAEEFVSDAVRFRDIVHPEDMDRVGKEIQAYAEQEVEEYTQHYRIVTRKGESRYVEDRTSVVRDADGNKVYNQGIVVDVTARAIAEEKVRKSEEKFRRILETTGEGFLLMDEELCIVDANDAYCRMLGYEREELLGRTPMEMATDSYRQFLTAGREEILSMDFRKLEGTLQTKEGRSVPVLIHGNTLRDDAGNQIGNIAFVSDLTEQKRALELAGQVQRSLLPSRAPAAPGLDIAGRSDACEEVGGDYLDYFAGAPDTPDALRIVVGDISGHGVDAALLMTSARAFIHTQAERQRSPAQVVSSMNRYLSSDMAETGHFMTLFLMEIDPIRQTARWVRAGHDPALVFLPHEDRFTELGGTGMPLGVDAGAEYNESGSDGLAPGTVIALGTDGIWEAEDFSGRPFGKERLQGIIRRNAAHSAATILQTVFDELERFTGGVPAHDDVTLVIVKVGSEAV
jgi:sigma-B regulation protein RsbU (phosphoserine phosphatase)